MKNNTQVVVIGGGVVGCSVLFHLTRMGWTDVVLVERKELTAGSTWHAAGGYHSLNGDPNVSRLQAYTISLYREIQEISGQDVGLHATGGISLAATDSRWEFLQNEAARHHVLGIESRLVTPREIAGLCPIVNVDGLRGGLYMEHEGHVDPYGVTHAYAKAARIQGAEIYRQTRVTKLEQNSDSTWRVITDKGVITAQHVVNAAGLWAREVGEMAGVHLPLIPMEHHYLLTDSLPSLSGREQEIPTIVDLDGEMYLRQEQAGVLLGVYETPATPWAVEGTPWDYGETDLLPDKLDRLQSALEKGFRRFPEVEQAGIKKIVNGPFTFTPDGNPLVGPVLSAENYWSACGVMAGFAQGGGVGLALAQWMVNGEPDGDVFAMDVARFGDYADADYTRKRAMEFYERRFRLAYPNEQWPAGRPARKSPLYEKLGGQGAVFGASDGMEYPLYFSRTGETREETPSFYRSNAFATVGEECRAARSDAAVLDAAAYGKYQVSGPEAAAWLDHLLASRLPAPGRARLAVMLSRGGRILGDLTVLRPRADRFMLVGSGAMQRAHMRWFHKNLSGAKVKVENVTDAWCGLVVTGPRSRDIMQQLLNTDLSGARMPFLHVQEMDLAGTDALLARISFSGELGFELYMPAAAGLETYELLFRAAARARAGLRNMGLYALNSLRLEKGYGIWSREISPDYTPSMCGLDRFIDYDKKEFIGREAALRTRTSQPERRLVTLEILSPNFDLWGYEPVWRGNRLAGYTTSGGFGHCTGKSLAKGYINSEFLDSDSSFEVETLGRRVAARLLDRAPYDPGGTRLRS